MKKIQIKKQSLKPTQASTSSNSTGSAETSSSPLPQNKVDVGEANRIFQEKERLELERGVLEKKIQEEEFQVRQLEQTINNNTGGDTDSQERKIEGSQFLGKIFGWIGGR